MSKLVYVAHQVSGNIEENVKSILRICHNIHKQDTDVIPFAPYLVALQYLNDNITEERNLGIQANIEHFQRKKMDEIWLCGPKISSGMEQEIDLSLENKIPIKCYNPNLKSKLDELLKSGQRID